MKMQLTDTETWECLRAATKHEEINGIGSGNRARHNQTSYMEYLVECAEAIGSEWAVAKYFNLPFDPYEIKMKVKADVGKG